MSRLIGDELRDAPAMMIDKETNMEKSLSGCD
jgi:hypothetical protein